MSRWLVLPTVTGHAVTTYAIGSEDAASVTGLWTCECGARAATPIAESHGSALEHLRLLALEAPCDKV